MRRWHVSHGIGYRSQRLNRWVRKSKKRSSVAIGSCGSDRHEPGIVDLGFTVEAVGYERATPGDRPVQARHIRR